MPQKKITTLDEIQAQLEPETVDIPGFKPGSFITVLLRSVDLTPHILDAGLANPLVGPTLRRTNEYTSQEQSSEEGPDETLAVDPRHSLDQVMPVIDAVVKEALVSPTWDEISAVHPLSWNQKSAIFQKSVGDVRVLRSFRGK